MKYSFNQVAAWAHRLVAGDSQYAIVQDLGLKSTRLIRRQFKLHGLASPSTYSNGLADAPPLPETDSEPDNDLAGMVPFIGPHLRRAVEGLIKHGSIEAAANALNATPAILRARLSEAHHLSARRGWSPAHDMTSTTPPGMHVRGVSNHYSRDPVTGVEELTSKWVKMERDAESRVQLLLDAMREVCEGLDGKAKPRKAPKFDTKKWLAVYPMGDPHIGLFADHEFTRDDDHDLDRGQSVLYSATEQLVQLAPACEEALIINLGDFFHSDSMSNMTGRSGHHLDVSGMWAKILRVGINAMIRCVEVALSKHQKVTVICEIGNHDDHSAIMLALAVQLYFRKEPRVAVDMSPQSFHWFRFHNNLLGVHHGHKTKMERLPGIMAVDQRAQWGETAFHYWYTGHVHHLQTKEFPGCIVDSFRTMAPKDKYHADSGYRSGRSMELDLIHAQYGRRARHSIGIEMLKSMMEDS